MNKTELKSFAVSARLQLVEAARQRAFEYGITKSGVCDVTGRVLTRQEQHQRQQLIGQIRHKGYDQVLEEGAYLWFNRFVALRFMEVNGFLPSKVRVFTDGQDAFQPEILKEAMTVELDGLDRSKVLELLERQDNEGLYKYLLITQCNALNRRLPDMFEMISHWTELLFPGNLLRPDSVVGQLVAQIPQEDWLDAVQTIGWLYQYYNSELKDDTFARLKSNVKISKERIPAATQLFTPDWIVRYMVENSLGRLYINAQLEMEGKVLSEVQRVAAEQELATRMGWHYYLPEAERAPAVCPRRMSTAVNLEDLTKIKFIDPCMGSGHVLVYAFDVLMQIYTARGWSERDAAISILENNLYGLDLDDRAGQLSYFAVMMKARKYHRRILNGAIRPNVYAIQDSGFMTDEWIVRAAGGDREMEAQLLLLRDGFQDAKEYGSLLTVPRVNVDALLKRLDGMDATLREPLVPLVKQAQILAGRYDAVVTNPPYMGAGSMGDKLSSYVKKHYPAGKSDLFGVFMERCRELTKADAYFSLVTMHSWMFLRSFEELRQKLQRENTLINLLHLGSNAFGSDVGTIVQNAAFVYRKTPPEDDITTFHRSVEVQNPARKEQCFLKRENLFYRSAKVFQTIPGGPLAYWISDTMERAFALEQNVSSLGRPKQGMATADNSRFVRAWYEVSAWKTSLFAPGPAKWYPYNNGGGYRKWYGLNTDVVNWENNGAQIKAFPKACVRNEADYFKPGITWNAISTDLSVRYFAEGFLFSNAGMALFSSSDNLYYLQGLLNSCFAEAVLEILCPTFNYNAGDMNRIPLRYDRQKAPTVIRTVQDSIAISKSDWNAFEISWEFQRHPLI